MQSVHRSFQRDLKVRSFFRCAVASLQEVVSIGPSVRRSVRPSRVIFRRVLGASLAVYPALFMSIDVQALRVQNPFLTFRDFNPNSTKDINGRFLITQHSFSKVKIILTFLTSYLSWDRGLPSSEGRRVPRVVESWGHCHDKSFCNHHNNILQRNASLGTCFQCNRSLCLAL